MKKYELKDPIYRRYAWVIFGEKKEFVSYFNKKYDCEPLEEAGFGYASCIRFDKNGVIHHYIVFTKEAMNYRAIVHEVVHFVYGVFRNIGAEIERDSEEIMAYYSDYTFDQIRKLMDKEKKRGKVTKRNKS